MALQKKVKVVDLQKKVKVVDFGRFFVYLGNRAEDVINGIIGGDRAVEGDEVALKPLWNVVPASSRVDHCRHVLQTVVRGNRFDKTIYHLHILS